MNEMLSRRKVILDESSLKELFYLHFDSICRFLNYYTSDEDLIKDIVQDVFTKLWEDRKKVEIFYIKTYLYNSARNRILNSIRDQKNRQELLEEWALKEIEKLKAEDCVNMEEFSSIYNNAIGQLPDKCREIFQLSRDEKLTYNEIAKQNQISIKTVETQISTATAKIKKYIQNYYNSLDNNTMKLIIVLFLHQILY